MDTCARARRRTRTAARAAAGGLAHRASERDLAESQRACGTAAVEPVESLADRGVRLRERVERPVAERRQDPALSHLDADLRLRLVPGFPGPSRDDGAAVMGRELLVCPVEIGLVAVGPAHRSPEVVGNEERRAPAEELEAADVSPDPVRQRLAGQRFGIRVVARAQDGDEELGSGDHPRRSVDDRDRRPGEVEEELLAGTMLLAHDDVQAARVGPITLGEPRVAEAIGAALTVFGPEEHERDALAVQLTVDARPIGFRATKDRGRRCRAFAEEPFLELAIVECVGERPRQARVCGPVEIVADGCSGQADGDADGPGTQVLGRMEPQDFTDLAHGSTGTGHRFFSSTVWSRRGWPMRRASRGRWRAPHRVAKTRGTAWPIRSGIGWPKPGGIRWPKPAKSAVGQDDGSEKDRTLNGHAVAEINANLTAGMDITQARVLPENAGLSYMGDTKGGPFDIDDATARRLLAAPNPDGRSNADVVRPWVNGDDITGRRRGWWIIDFGVSMSVEEAALYEAPFELVRQRVRPHRQDVRRLAYAERWWLHVEPRSGMRVALSGLRGYVVTPRVSKHRVFVWLASDTLPDSRLIVFARDDDYFFGALSSKLHEAWALSTGPRHETRPTYTPTTCFETFPFPRPTDTQREAIAEAARDLDRLRTGWLNPPGLSDADLAKRTLTNLYNARPTWLAQAHERLDAAVLAAYGWPADIDHEELLAGLLALNLARAAGEKTGD